MPTTYTIPNGRTVFDATTYTGTGATQTINNSDIATTGFLPDFTWIKLRGSVTDHRLVDTVRGATKEIYSSSTSAQVTDTNGLTAFTSTGFTVGSTGAYNSNGGSLVAWQWNAGSNTTSSNTSGSVTSTVSVNQTAGFSIATCTLPNSGTSGTVGHGLGAVPNMYIVKYTTVGSDWRVYHSSLGQSQYLVLNKTDAAASSTTVWNNTAPTSSVLSLGSNYFPDASSNILLIYSWTAIPGFSAFGSYTGNGSANGPFIYTGFRPKFVMFKNSSAVAPWCIVDTSRDTYNVETLQLYPNAQDAESSNTTLDGLSNGFKIRSSASGPNGNTNVIIYAAFAENPFKYANAR